MVARVVPVEPFDLVVFGATGDLAQRKLFPALYHRVCDGQMPTGARVIGAARRTMSREEFQNLARSALETYVPDVERSPEMTGAFLRMLDYVVVDVEHPHGMQTLVDLLGPNGARPRAFYLSVAPTLFAPIADLIAASGAADHNTRIVLEKPLGKDLSSAQQLNAQLVRAFDEHQIYRIDHYLGKETVQNLMVLRFANSLFEPLWNAQHVDHVQITVAESVGIEGRGETYDNVGAMRDMVQNHLMQLLCLTAMEPPTRFDPDMVRDEKLKVLRALAPLDPRNDAVRGQYRSSNGTPSYLEDTSKAESMTETYVALRVHVANWRWSGVPFYLRTGKRLRARHSEIAVTFKEAPHSIFGGPESGYEANVLTIRLQPNEGIKLGMTIKDPGPGGMRLTSTNLDMSFADKMGGSLRMPDAYERLVMDVIRGDQTLFMRGDEVEAAWAWSDPVVAAWEEMGIPPQLYDPGSSGPDDAMMLLHKDGRRWREIDG